MIPQMLEVQKLLMQRNEDVERLNRLVVSKRLGYVDLTLSAIFQMQKQDEAIQLRALNHLQGGKAKNKPAPRRGTRASLDPVRNSSTRTIQIPLDPIAIPEAPSGKPNPKPKAKLAATPALAELLGTDVPTLGDFIGQLEQLFISGGVTVNIEETTPKKGNGKNKSKKKSDKKPPNELKNYINVSETFVISYHTLNEAGP